MIEELLAYQKEDANLRKIEKEFAESDDRKKAFSAKKFLDGVEDSVNNLDSRAGELARAYEKANEELERLKEQEEEFDHAVKSAEDLTAVSYVLKKIDELLANIKLLSGKTAKISEEIQAVMKEYVSIKNNTKAAQAQYKESGEKYNKLKASRQAEKSEIEGKLEQLKQKVDKNLMERYLNKRAQKMYPVVFEAQNNACGCCHMELSMSAVTKLKNGEIIECESCGRLLYRKSD